MKLDKAGLSGKSDAWWSFWLPADIGLKVEPNWAKQAEPWLDIQRDAADPNSMVSKILDLSLRVRNALDAKN